MPTSLSGPLSDAADLIKWPRVPELRESEQMARVFSAARYYPAEELAGASAADRAQLYRALSGRMPGWARLLRKMLDAEAPPTQVEPGKSPPFTEVDVFAAIKFDETLQLIGELLRPRQEAVNLSSEVSRGGSKACPPYGPILPPRFG